MRVAKKAAWVLSGVLLLLAGGVFALILAVGGAGESALEAWIGGELRTAVNARLKPELRFDSLDYQAPSTVVLTGVRLSAEDPDRPGATVDVVAADRVRIVLAEMPRRGEPLKIASLELAGGAVRLVESRSADGLIGLSDLLEEEPDADAPPLSEVLQITRIVIRDAAIVYDTRQPGVEPMSFDQIDTVLDIDEDDLGAYALDLDLKRGPAFATTLAGSLDLDTMTLAVADLKTSMRVGREQDLYLPPQVQAFIKSHDLHGDLSLTGSGLLDINDVAASIADIKLTLADANGAVAGYRLPIQRLEVDAALAERYVTLRRLSGRLIDGEVSGDGGFSLDDAMPATLKLSGNGLRIDQLSADTPDGSPPPFAGRVDLQLNAEAPLTDTLNQMAGGGELRVDDGRIARLPVVSDLIDFMRSAGRLGDAGDASSGGDRAKLVFELRGDHAYLSEADIVGAWFAMRGRGKVFFDGALAMQLNAGPLEKVQSSLGALGQVFGAVTDGLVAYRVTGTFDDKTIRPVPLAGIIGAPGDDE